MVSTGKYHGFESIAVQKVLTAIDFAGWAIEVMAQPFRLRFWLSSGRREHVPDFLVIGQDSVLLIDVRPADRIGYADRIAFAAAAELASAAGWVYLLASGWRGEVWSILDALSAQRRQLADPLGLQPLLLAAAANGPVRFGQLANTTQIPAVARAHALHLIWHRRLCLDLDVGLNDGSLVWLTGGCGHG